MGCCHPARKARHRRQARLVDDVETHLEHIVGHANIVTEPARQVELVLPNQTTVPAALSQAIAQRGLELVPDASGTQGAGGHLVVVVR